MISCIVAMSENYVIGRDGDMPWRMSADLKRFKRITMGHHMLMGRKTFDSIGRPLPGRTSVVISRTATYDHPQIRVARSLDEALEVAANDDEPFITGGEQIFRLAMPLIERIYLTRIHQTIDGDTHFPEVDWQVWELKREEHHRADDKNQYDHTFQIWDRTRNA